VRLQLGKAARALASAIAQDPSHRQLGVVVQDRARHPTEEAEGGDVPVQESFGALGRVGSDETRIRVGQVEAEEVDGLPHTPDHRNCLTKVDLGMAGRMDEGNEHLLGAGLLLAHVVLHGGVATRKAVLVTQALIDPLGRVALLRRR
jgi:hypothetical protein